MTDGSVSPDAVVIERSFDAPPALIWQMWTDPEHFKAWYGPDGVTLPVTKMDVRVGGSRLVCMEMNTPGGLTGRSVLRGGDDPESERFRSAGRLVAGHRR